MPVTSANREALSRALQALAIRIARAINRVLGRTGKVFADRYHMADPQDADGGEERAPLRARRPVEAQPAAPRLFCRAG
jgi:hypothetical protein